MIMVLFVMILFANDFHEIYKNHKENNTTEITEIYTSSTKPTESIARKPTETTAETTTETTTECSTESEWVTFRVTAYCPCEKCCGEYALNRPKDKDGKPIITGASGRRLVEGISVAGDTSIYPMGTKLEIQGYGVFFVDDRGGAIKGNRLDMYFDNHEEAQNFGVKYLKVKIIK